jgi:hypothetical protein
VAIVNTYQTLYPGYGQPSVYGVKNAVSLTTTGQQTNTFNAANTPGIGQGMTKGLARVKVYNGGGTSPTVAIIVQVTDGTNTYIVANIPATAVAALANSGVDFYIDFGVDISFNAMSILTTLGGTTPTASMDAELVTGP